MAEVIILCPLCHKPNIRTTDNLVRARFCQHCGKDVVLNNDGPRYYITRIIKEGGQGAVYEAIDDKLRVYAVKEMLDRFLDTSERAEAISRFETEAVVLQQLTHPRIPRIYASFKDEGRHYLVMDFVRGHDLEDLLKHQQTIPEPQALAWAAQLCDVLEYLHRCNPPIIFRDMKPSNVMIEADGGVKVIDFGIAKVLQPSQRGTQIGTPGYAPPEQYQGIASPESDIYALSATLHHMLTGRDPRDEPPFSFPPVRLLNPNVSQRTADALAKGLQMKPEDRPHSMSELRALLQPHTATTPIRPAQPAQRPQPQVPAQQPAQRPAQQPSMQQPAQRPAQQPATARPPVQNAPPPATARPQAQPAPVQQAARPQAQSAPQPATARPQPAGKKTPKQLPPQPVQPARQGISVLGMLGRFIALVVVILLIAAVVLFAVPGLSAQLFPAITPNLQPTTAPVLRTIPFDTTIELIVPQSQDIYTAFRAAYAQQAKAQYGEGAQVNTNAVSFIGAPERIGEESAGVKYRATMTGFVQVPQGP